ncbi:hypothetical protein [Luteibacter jiangsuensis]
MGDDNVPSWESIGTNAVATAAGTYIGNKLSPSPSAQANLASWNRQGGGLGAYGALGTGGNGYSLVEGTPSVGSAGYAYLDNGSALRSYGLNYYAGTRAIDAAIGSDALTNTPQGNVRVEDVQWSGSDGSLGYGGIGFPMRPVAIPYTAEPIPTLSSADVTANQAGIIDEHYDPIWARQQAALAAQASEMDAANQQRLSDFFNDQQLHIVGTPIYALSGAAKEAVNGAKWLGHALWAGGELQASKYAAFGAAARGDLRGIDAADRLGAQAIADATRPVAPVFQVSEFEHAAAFGVAPFNPEEAVVAGMSFVERVASGLSGVTRVGASVDGMMAARGGFEAAEGAVAPAAFGSADRFGVLASAERDSIPLSEVQAAQDARMEATMAGAYDAEGVSVSWANERAVSQVGARGIVPDTVITSGGQADLAQYAQLKAFYAAQDPGYVSQATQIQNVSTFQTLGVDNAVAQGYLATPSGQNMLNALWAADPSASDAAIYARAIDQLSTGAALPDAQVVTTPLVKIVPEGAGVGPNSPFFTTPEELTRAAQSGMTLADYFGLPLKSESATYSIYQISPTQPAGVFVNQLAPTIELGGLIQRSGGGVQYIVPNRKLWSDPALIGTTHN